MEQAEKQIVAAQAAVVPQGDSGRESSIADSSVSSNSQSEYLIRLEFFQGPMDLLLHLVSRQEVSVEEVKMTEIASQYLEIVMNNAERLDLEKAGEYLVIASTLLAIKSSALIPAENSETEEITSDWDENNPFFADLRERLRVYRQTQERAELLRSIPQLNVDTFARRDRKLLQPTSEMMQEPEDVFSLGGIFASLMKRIGEVSSFRITAQPFSVVDFMVSIVESLGVGTKNKILPEQGQRFGFSTLLRSLRATSKKGSNRTVVIGGFIAVLELMKRGVLAANVVTSESEQQDLESLEHFSVSLKVDTSEKALSEGFESEFDGLDDDSAEQLSSEDNVVHIDQYRSVADSNSSAKQANSAQSSSVQSDTEFDSQDEVVERVVGLSGSIGE